MNWRPRIPGVVAVESLVNEYRIGTDYGPQVIYCVLTK